MPPMVWKEKAVTRTVAPRLRGVDLGRIIVLPLLHRKEVIQPQVPLRLPCYDLVPIAKFIFGA